MERHSAPPPLPKGRGRPCLPCRCAAAAQQKHPPSFSEQGPSARGNFCRPQEMKKPVNHFDCLPLHNASKNNVSVSSQGATRTLPTHAIHMPKSQWHTAYVTQVPLPNQETVLYASQRGCFHLGTHKSFIRRWNSLFPFLEAFGTVVFPLGTLF